MDGEDERTFLLEGNRSTLIVILIVALVVVVGVFVVILFCYRKFVMHNYAPLLGRYCMLILPEFIFFHSLGCGAKNWLAP